MPRQVPTPRTVEIPSAEAVAKERERLQYKKKYNRTLRSTIYALLVVAALAVLEIGVTLIHQRLMGVSEQKSASLRQFRHIVDAVVQPASENMAVRAEQAHAVG